MEVQTLSEINKGQFRYDPTLRAIARSDEQGFRDAGFLVKRDDQYEDIAGQRKLHHEFFVATSPNGNVKISRWSGCHLKGELFVAYTIYGTGPAVEGTWNQVSTELKELARSEGLDNGKDMDEVDGQDLEDLLGYEIHDWWEDCNDDSSTMIAIPGFTINASRDYWYLPEEYEDHGFCARAGKRINDITRIKEILKNVAANLPDDFSPPNRVDTIVLDSKQRTLDI